MLFSLFLVVFVIFCGFLFCFVFGGFFNHPCRYKLIVVFVIIVDTVYFGLPKPHEVLLSEFRICTAMKQGQYSETRATARGGDWVMGLCLIGR